MTCEMPYRIPDGESRTNKHACGMKMFEELATSTCSPRTFYGLRAKAKRKTAVLGLVTVTEVRGSSPPLPLSPPSGAEAHQGVPPAAVPLDPQTPTGPKFRSTPGPPPKALCRLFFGSVRCSQHNGQTRVQAHSVLARVRAHTVLTRLYAYAYMHLRSQHLSCANPWEADFCFCRAPPHRDLCTDRSRTMLKKRAAIP